MRFKITYCGMWNYKPRAASLADDLKKEFNAEAELVESGGGVFEIELDDKLIFSKKKLNRFPEDGEIVKLVSDG